ncbi:MAG: AAA-like domain-containing protein [Calothrix sp. MO_192.B10]|nr:AAA-like domain-containing protein [Calothrix sp. MO_192.B10]
MVKKILLLSANPTNTSKLRLDEEVREIEAGLKRAKRREEFEIISKLAVRVDDLRRALLDYEPQIVHFSGHGLGSQGLALENNSGQMQLVSASALARLFKLFPQIECVLLNACYSEVQAEAIHQYIDYVIGMNKAIGDKAAIKFAVGFYDALGAGRNIEDGFEFGCTSIDLESIPESSTPVLKSIKSRKGTAIPQFSPSVQPGALEIPEGTMKLKSAFYVERKADKIALNMIVQQGVTIFIKGLRQVGKSSLLNRIIKMARNQNKRVLFIDFQLFGKADLSSDEVFLSQFCSWLSEELEIEDRVDQYWQKNISNIQRCTRYVSRYILKELDSPLVLVIDEMDKIFGTPFSNDFFGMLRNWHNSRAMSEIWNHLDLILVTSTEPYQLIDDLNQSPFNVGQVIELEDFTSEQVAELNRRHGLPFNTSAEMELMTLLN